MMRRLEMGLSFSTEKQSVSSDLSQKNHSRKTKTNKAPQQSVSNAALSRMDAIRQKNKAANDQLLELQAQVQREQQQSPLSLKA